MTAYLTAGATNVALRDVYDPERPEKVLALESAPDGVNGAAYITGTPAELRALAARITAAASLARPDA